ncbi:MAG TPA: CHAD domain-containing protein [Solirubrobacterales bacterium]|nr:CHAD domain-containing protein [Solirubrobacterales bacterium]
MARPRDVPGLDCEEPFSRAAARVLSVRAAELFEHVHGVRGGGDVEAIHDMRVATRRLRAALELFEACFPRKRLRKARRELKAMGDALGERRDRDVEIEFLERFLEEADPEDAEQVARLVVRLRVEQQQASEGLGPAIATERLEKLRRRLDRLIAEAGP